MIDSSNHGRRRRPAPTSRTPTGSRRGSRRSTRPRARSRGTLRSTRRASGGGCPRRRRARRSSALRLPVTMNSEPAPATIRNHGEMSTPTATPPAIGAQHEPGGDGGEVEHRLVLQPEAVRERERDVAGDDERELPARQRTTARSRRRRGTTAADDRGAHRRPRPAATGRKRLRGVQAVGVDVERVVQVVGAARGEAEADERDRRCRDSASASVEHARPRRARRARARSSIHCFGRARRSNAAASTRGAHARARSGGDPAVRGDLRGRVRGSRAQISSGSCSMSSTSVVDAHRRMPRRMRTHEARSPSRRRRDAQPARKPSSTRRKRSSATAVTADERDDARPPTRSRPRA